MKMLDVPQSGSQGRETSSRNRFGQYKRARSIPVQPRTVHQVNARNTLSRAAANWRGLTDAQRAAWEVSSAHHTKQDSLGQTVQLSGFQTFVSVNANLARLEEPDAVLLPPAVRPVFGDMAIAFDASLADLGPIVQAGPPLTGVSCFCWLTPPQSPGVSFAKGYRLIEVVTEPDSDAGLPSWLAITARFGAAIVGQKYFYRLVPVKDGIQGPAIAGSFIVVA